MKIQQFVYFWKVKIQPAQAIGKLPLIFKSVVWDYFKKLPQDRDKAQCNARSESLKHSLNTSDLFKVCKQYKIVQYMNVTDNALLIYAI